MSLLILPAPEMQAYLFDIVVPLVACRSIALTDTMSSLSAQLDVVPRDSVSSALSVQAKSKEPTQQLVATRSTAKL